MENTEVQTVVDNFSIESLTAGSKEKAVAGTEAKRLDRTVFSIHPSKLTVLPDFNPRIDSEKLQARVRMYADSIKEHGFYLHKPIAVIVIKQEGKDVLAVYDGHTRLKAAFLAISEGYPLEAVYISVAPAGTTMEDITAGLHTNNPDCRLEPLELGFICKRMRGYGLDNTAIAKKLAISVAYVGQLFELVGADRKIRDLVNEDKISATMALQVIKEEGENAPKVLEDAVKTAEAQGKTKATKKHVKSTVKKDSPVIEVQAKNADSVHQAFASAHNANSTPSGTVQPLMPSPSVTPYEAKAVSEALTFSQAAMFNHGIEWMKANIGIVDDSHYALFSAITGSSIQEIRETLE